MTMEWIGVIERIRHYNGFTHDAMIALRDAHRDSINVPYLRKVLEHVTAHPEQHDQTAWAVRSECGTAYCLFGWAVVLRDGPDVIDWTNGDTLSPPWAGQSTVSAFTLRDFTAIDDRAAELLGLSQPWATWLSSPLNTLTDLWQLAEFLTDGEIVPPELTR